MEDERTLAGSWTGELVDVHGFRGELRLDLAYGGEGAVKGEYSVSVATEHDTLTRRGEVSGTSARGRVKLALSMREPPVKMGLDADVIPLRGGGLGLRGTYQVSARAFSPLEGGIVVLARDRRQEAQLVSRGDRREEGR